MRRSITMALTVLVVAPAAAGAQADRVVTGRVLASSDSTAVPGARVRVLGIAVRTTTDADGRFRLSGLPAAGVRLVFERIGLVPDTMDVGAATAEVTVYVRARPVLLKPIIAEAAPIARERFELIAQTSTVSLDPLEITEMPAIAEPDVARVVQLLPGTVAKNDFSTGFNVRGGETDQNLIRLDGVTVFNPSHLGGLFSTFDPSAVERVDFITGAFPAALGGRLSSVMDVELASGSRSRTAVKGSVSLLSSKVLVSGPLAGDVTYLAAARRTYADAFADNFSDDPFTYYFTDALGKITVPMWRGGSVSLTGYWGKDDLELPWVDPQPERPGVDLAFDWGNRLVGLNFKQPLGRAVLEAHASVSEFSTFLGLVPDVFTSENTARVHSGQLGLGLAAGRGHEIRVGGGVDDYAMRYRVFDDALSLELLELTYRPRVYSAYLDDQWKPAGWLLLRPGVRVEHVTGADFTSVSPRVGAKVFLSSNLALVGSTGRYHQAVHSMRDQELPITVFDIWIGADPVTPVARSDHVVGGFEAWLDENTSLTVEGYHKTFANLVIRNRADDDKVKGDEFIPADGDARGIDVLLRRHFGRASGWIAYSYMWTERRTATDTFPPAHDRRHTFNIVLQAPGPFGSRMGVRWGYGSPLPYTGITGQWLHREYNAAENLYDGWEEEAIGGELNGERYPHYSRLDVSFRWQARVLGGTLRPYLQVVNAYNRQNVFVYTFDYRSVPPTRSGFTQLPVLPTLGVEFEW